MQTVELIDEKKFQANNPNNAYSKGRLNEIYKEFISAYEQCPVLWDTRHVHYSNQIERNNAYDVLLDVLRKLDVNATRECVKKQINSLRSNYRRLLRRHLSSKAFIDGEEVYRFVPTSWKFYALRFLDSVERSVMNKSEKKFLKRLLILMLHLLLLSVSVYLRHSSLESDGDPSWGLVVDDARSGIRLACELGTIVSTLCYIILQQGDELKNQGLVAYFKQLIHEPAKFIFLASNLLLLACIPARLSQQTMLEEAILIFVLPGSWFLLMFFAGAVKLTGPFVTMIYSMITGDMFTFGIIYCIVLFGFSQSFFFLYKGFPNVQSTLFSSYPSTWMALFQITLGDYSYSDLSMTTYPNLSKTVFALFMVFVPILLLNMLIAMMGNTYAHVIEQSEKEWVKQWAKIVVSLERSVAQEDAHRYLQEYSIGLGPSDDPRYEQRGVMVIKSKAKTRAKQRKGALANWKRVGRVTIAELRKRGITGEELRRMMWGRVSISSPTKNPPRKAPPPDCVVPGGGGVVGAGVGSALTSALDVMAFDMELGTDPTQKQLPPDLLMNGKAMLNNQVGQNQISTGLSQGVVIAGVAQPLVGQGLAPNVQGPLVQNTQRPNIQSPIGPVQNQALVNPSMQVQIPLGQNVQNQVGQIQNQLPSGQIGPNAQIMQNQYLQVTQNAQGQIMTVGPNAQLLPNVQNQMLMIGPNGQMVSVGQNVQLGQNPQLGQNMQLGQNVQLGQTMQLGQNVPLGQNMQLGYDQIAVSGNFLEVPHPQGSIYMPPYTNETFKDYLLELVVLSESETPREDKIRDLAKQAADLQGVPEIDINSINAARSARKVVAGAVSGLFGVAADAPQTDWRRERHDHSDSDPVSDSVLLGRASRTRRARSATKRAAPPPPHLYVPARSMYLVASESSAVESDAPWDEPPNSAAVRGTEAERIRAVRPACIAAATGHAPQEHSVYIIGTGSGAEVESAPTQMKHERRRERPKTARHRRNRVSPVPETGAGSPLEPWATAPLSRLSNFIRSSSASTTSLASQAEDSPRY